MVRDEFNLRTPSFVYACAVRYTRLLPYAHGGWLLLDGQVM